MIMSKYAQCACLGVLLHGVAQASNSQETNSHDAIIPGHCHGKHASSWRKFWDSEYPHIPIEDRISPKELKRLHQGSPNILKKLRKGEVGNITKFAKQLADQNLTGNKLEDLLTRVCSKSPSEVTMLFGADDIDQWFKLLGMDRRGRLARLCGVLPESVTGGPELDTTKTGSWDECYTELQRALDVRQSQWMKYENIMAIEAEKIIEGNLTVDNEYYETYSAKAKRFFENYHNMEMARRAIAALGPDDYERLSDEVRTNLMKLANDSGHPLLDQNRERALKEIGLSDDDAHKLSCAVAEALGEDCNATMRQELHDHMRDIESLLPWHGSTSLTGSIVAAQADSQCMIPKSVAQNSDRLIANTASMNHFSGIVAKFALRLYGLVLKRSSGRRRLPQTEASHVSVPVSSSWLTYCVQVSLICLVYYIIFKRYQRASDSVNQSKEGEIPLYD